MIIIRVVSILSLSCLLVSCKQDKNQYTGQEAIKYNQYLFQGEQLYFSRCLNCHQNDGSGLGKLIPPLTTDFLKIKKQTAICIVKHGLEGPIQINGINYDRTMPSNPRLTPLEIAELMTYISNSWGNEYGMVTIQEVEEALKDCN
ncbi:MAG: cytochrome c [Reichenbachiella sp.]|uniref:c-type cytochrome n=1 Tax=Reichenbachiella sp. TaxID=2184521 RepID=UPI00326784DB